MFGKSATCNDNYTAIIINIKEFHPHSDPKVERMKVANIHGNAVITGIDAKSGLYCYFPLECCINTEFLAFTNSFTTAQDNYDNSKRGFFEKNGRVKAIRLRQQKSEGYIVPVSTLEEYAKGVLGKNVKITEDYTDVDFDTFLDVQFCKKYIPKNVKTPNTNVSKKTKGNVKRYESKLIENQFHFHPSTAQLKRCVENVDPDARIAITEKYHGTSFVVSNVLVKKKLNWKEKMGKMLRIPVVDKEYGMLYSSRSVLKNVAMDNPYATNGFYDADVWKIVADKCFPALKDGYSFYGEIVGFTPSGNMIQKGYDYGCAPGTLDYLVYRMTYTNVSGDVFELSHDQMVAYCAHFGIKTPYVHYFGKAKDHFPEIPVDEKWHDAFLDKMINTYLEKDCKYCKNKVPAEGVVLRVDKPNQWEVYKLKSFRFLERESAELDTGEVDMETEQSVSE